MIDFPYYIPNRKTGLKKSDFSRDTANASPPSLIGDLLLVIDCDVSVYIGAAVYLDGGGIAQNGLANATSTSNVLGIVETKQTPTRCVVRVAGITPEHFTGLVEDTQYFLSATIPGEITTTVPGGPGHLIAPVGTPITDKRLSIKIGDRTKRKN